MQLVEIKKNHTGTGLLIENDGYISVDVGGNRNLVESIRLNEGLEGGYVWDIPRPFIVSAVFQKYDIENANGRIYPEAVLKEQVEKYMQKIADRRGYGECYRPEAKILTETGWKKLADVKEGENVLTLNVETNKIEIKPIIRKIEHKYEGNLINVAGRNIDDLVTPGHKYVIFDRNNKYKGSYSVEELMNKSVPDMRHCYIPKNGEWVGLNDTEIKIPALTEEELSKITVQSLKDKYKEPLVIPMDIYAKFMGIYLSEGSCTKDNKLGYRTTIYQKKSDVCEEIEGMLGSWGIKYSTTITADGKHSYTISDMRLNKYLRQFGNCYDKYVPLFLKMQNKDTLRTFYDWFVMGDGRIRGDKRVSTSLTDDVFSTSERLVNDLNEIQLKIGFSGNIHFENRQNDRFIGDRLIEGKNCHNMYFSLRSLVKGTYLDDRFITFTEVPYTGDVMCIEVENHSWYVMDNNKCHWTSNCNHPEDSSINLSRIGMNIVELHWEGHTLVGQIEIPLTEGYRRFGIVSTTGDEVANLLMNNLKIGVSSRGVGSVEQRYGKYMVGDDYELICWDVVSDPSTPNAWISSNKEELQQYVESRVNEKNTLLEKLEKFDGWLIK